MRSAIIAIIVLGLVSYGVTAQSTIDCKPKPLRTIENLSKVIDQHETFLKTGGQQGKKADLSYCDLSKELSKKQIFAGRNLSDADFTGARLHKASFKGSTLEETIFTCAELQYANFQNAKLFKAKMEGSKLDYAQLDKDTYLFEAVLDGADLYKTSFKGADLAKASFKGALFRETDLEKANFRAVNLKDALYQPVNAPGSGHVSGIKGLESVRLELATPDFSGLVQLRKSLIDAGLRNLEREATYAIEVARTKHLWREFLSDKLSNIFSGVHAAIRCVLFDLPTRYCLSPLRPLLIIGLISAGFSFLYFGVLLFEPAKKDRSGIFCIRPEGAISFKGMDQQGNLQYKSRDLAHVTRLVPSSRSRAFLWGIYFSILCAFRIGFREFNLGSWIARLQPNSLNLHAKGWLRSLSGAQSLISVYMVAMWLLTYFGRPFH